MNHFYQFVCSAKTESGKTLLNTSYAQAYVRVTVPEGKILQNSVILSFKKIISFE